ncbi:MAG: DEAD/DEAH box helicase [Saprospiraceae bacterium]
MKFKEFGFEEALLEGLDAMGFEKATPVQEQAIPIIMDQQDILAIAQTGTGKTAAFLLPVINRLTKNPTEGIDTLIIEPTRELATQVDLQIEGFSYFTPVSSIAVYGGRDGRAMELEKQALKKGASIIVATPGRLSAHLDLGYVDLSTIKHLILDEADRMLDMGFAQDIMGIVNQLPRNRQTLLFSATMPPQIRQFSKQLLRSPYKEISLAISKPAENILQGVYEVEDEGKVKLVEYLLQNRKSLGRVIIFASTKAKVRELSTVLQKRGLDVGAVHSDLEQEERERQLAAFKSGKISVIVATDVLSRGIDIKGIDLVLNFDVPGDAEDYVHRIGRTARADASGVALTLVNSKDWYKFEKIETLIDMKIRRSPLPDFLTNAASKAPNKSFYKKRGPRRNRPTNSSN